MLRALLHGSGAALRLFALTVLAALILPLEACLVDRCSKGTLMLAGGNGTAEAWVPELTLRLGDGTELRMSGQWWAYGEVRMFFETDLRSGGETLQFVDLEIDGMNPPEKSLMSCSEHEGWTKDLELPLSMTRRCTIMATPVAPIRSRDTIDIELALRTSHAGLEWKSIRAWARPCDWTWPFGIPGG